MVLGLLRFTNALGGTANFIYPGPTTDMQSPASAGAVDGTAYLYYAQSFDMSQWEIGTGAYTASSSTFARTTISANSLGTTAKINFGTPPQVVVFDTFSSLVSVIIAQSFTAAQQIQARQNIGSGGAVGNCNFAYVSSTSVALKPFNGSDIRINGTVQQIPSSGVTATNAGLVASTLYYVYAFMNAGVMTLEFSTTTHATDTTAGNVGVEIKSGDSTRTLVGMMFTNASSQFDDSAQKRNVRSWFNRKSAAINLVLGINTSITGTFSEVTAFRTEFVAWAGETVIPVPGFSYFNNTSGTVISVQFSANGVVFGQESQVNGDGTGGVRAFPGPAANAALAEGHTVMSVFASNSAGTASFYSQAGYGATISQ